MFDIQLSKSATKTLSTLPKKQARQVLMALDGLMLNPLPHDVKKLKGHEGFLRIDVGEYRIIYNVDIDIKIIRVYLIGKRNDNEVYRQFKRISKSQ